MRGAVVVDIQFKSHQDSDNIITLHRSPPVKKKNEIKLTFKTGETQLLINQSLVFIVAHKVKNPNWPEANQLAI